jgi:hypothetical protein
MSKNAAANGRHRDAMAPVTGHAGVYRLVACRVKKQRLGGGRVRLISAEAIKLDTLSDHDAGA